MKFVVGVCILDVPCYKDFAFSSKQCTLPEERIEMIKKVAQKKGIYEILANALGNLSLSSTIPLIHLTLGNISL